MKYLKISIDSNLKNELSNEMKYQFQKSICQNKNSENNRKILEICEPKLSRIGRNKMKLTINLQNYMTQLLDRFGVVMKQIRGHSKMESSLASFEMSDLPPITPGRQLPTSNNKGKGREHSPFQFPPLLDGKRKNRSEGKQDLFKNSADRVEGNDGQDDYKFSFRKETAGVGESEKNLGKKKGQNGSNPFDDFGSVMGQKQLLSKEPGKILKTEVFEDFDFSDLGDPNSGNQGKPASTMNLRGRRQGLRHMPKTSILQNNQSNNDDY